MAVSKVAYNGQTLIDLTGDTATAADVLTGKTFHLANGEQATGTNTGSITPTGTKNITTNGIHDVTSYANANVNVAGGTAVFGEAVSVSITLDNTPEEDGFDLDVAYRGYDPLDPTSIIWKTETFHFDNQGQTVTKTLYLTPIDEAYVDGIYVPVGDGGTRSNVYDCVNCVSAYWNMTAATGSEQVYVVCESITVSFTVYYSNL